MPDPTFQSVALSFAAVAKSLQSVKELVSGNARTQIVALYDIILTSQASAMEAHLKQTAMIERISELEKELARVKAWETEKQRYKLVQPCHGKGSIVYALKESISNGEPPHWICTKCYEDGRKSILNGREEHGKGMRAATYNCPVCNSSVEGDYANVTPAEYAPE